MKQTENVSNIADIDAAQDSQSRAPADEGKHERQPTREVEPQIIGSLSPFKETASADGDDSNGDQEAPGVLCPRQRPVPCGHLNPRNRDSCERCGVALPLNRKTLRTGRYARRENLPADLARIDLEARTFTEQALRDQGGAGLPAVHIGAVKIIGDLEYSRRALMHNLKMRGLTTKNGGVRSEFTALLGVLDRWLRYATLLGLERKDRNVIDLSPMEWLNEQDKPTGGEQ